MRLDLRREIQIGLNDLKAGRVSDWNVEEMKRRLRQRLKLRKSPKKGLML